MMKFSKKQKIILVPYPAQGHVTPMLKLASALLNYGFEPVMVIPQHIHSQISLQIEPGSKIVFIVLKDGLEKNQNPDFFAIESTMEHILPSQLEGLFGRLKVDGDGVLCVVADLLASWAIEVGNRCGVPVAGFWPASFATYRLIVAIPDMVREGLISDSGVPRHLGKISFLCDQPMLSTEDLPWLIGTLAARKARFKFWTRTLDRSKTVSLRWLLVNSFSDECNGYNHSQDQIRNPSTKGSLSLQCYPPLIYPIGPLCKCAPTINPSLWEEDTTCLLWLDKQEPDSVVYVSFGSWVSPIGEANVKELALSLETSQRPFIWVLRSAWREGLPNGFQERVGNRGRVYSWVPQVKVLQHKAVGCYITHCGWNSTMEAIQCQKRMLCYPIAGDQFLNCAYIVQIWKVGLKLHGFGERDVHEGLRQVMEDEEMVKRLMQMRKRTMGEEANLRISSNMAAFFNDLKK